MGPVVNSSTDATVCSGTLSYENRFVLPTDILFLVFMECDIRTLVTCRLVSSFSTIRGITWVLAMTETAPSGLQEL